MSGQARLEVRLKSSDTVLVTGGAGYIGSHIVLALNSGNRRAVVVDDLSTGWKSAVGATNVLVPIGVQSRHDIARLISEYQIKSVIHCAGSILIRESLERPLDYYRNNINNSVEFLDVCAASGIESFIFSSSASVYGLAQGRLIPEQAETKPISPYGRSKLMFEWVLRDVAERNGMRHGILRYFNVAGADPALRSGQSTRGATHIIKMAVEAAVGKHAGVEVFGTDYPTPDGTCIRDYVHVSDLATAHVLALEALESGDRADLLLNVGYGHGHSVAQVLDAVDTVLGYKLPRHAGPRREGDPPSLVSDASAIRRELGWTPAFDDLATIITHALAWEQLRGASERAPSQGRTDGALPPGPPAAHPIRKARGDPLDG